MTEEGNGNDGRGALELRGVGALMYNSHVLTSQNESPCLSAVSVTEPLLMHNFLIPPPPPPLTNNVGGGLLSRLRQCARAAAACALCVGAFAAGPAEAQANANLQNLTVSAPGVGRLRIAEFDADTLEYNAYVSYETTRITVAAVPGHVSATIAYSWQNGQNSGDVATAPLHTGRITTATITVTAHNGFNTRTYQVVVHRSRSHLANLEIAGNSFHFYSGGTDYNLNVREEFSTLRVTAMAVDSDATISITDPRGGGTLSGAGAAATTVGLPDGLLRAGYDDANNPLENPIENPIEIVVTGSDGMATTYIVVVVRANSPERGLETLTFSVGELMLSAGELMPPLATNRSGLGNRYTLSVASSITEVGITATWRPTINRALGPIAISRTFHVDNSEAFVNDPITFREGGRIVRGTLISRGTVSLPTPNTRVFEIRERQRAALNAPLLETYYVDITRAISNDASLSALGISAGTLTPAFASESTTYDVDVGPTVRSLTVTATANHASAEVRIEPGEMVEIGAGATPITATVTAEDGTTMRTYVITVTRPLPRLSGDATVSEGTTASYVVDLPMALPAGVSASWSWAVGGTGIDDRDVAVTGGVVIIAPGRSSASFSLMVEADGIAELAEVMVVSMSDARLMGAPDDVSLGVPDAAARTTIAANEFRLITVSAQPTQVDEGGITTFTVALADGVDQAVVVEYEIAAASEDLTPGDLEIVAEVERAGTSSAPVNTLPVTGSVTLGTDGTAQVSVRVASNDVSNEERERFRLRLTGCANCGTDYAAEIGSPSFAEVAIRGERGITVAAQVYLQGAYDRDELNMLTRLADILPRRQPYWVAPWNYPATTTVMHVPNDRPGLSGVTSTIVDWVLVELRSGANAAVAAAARPTTGGRAAGLLLSDGRIVGINEAATTTAEALSLEGIRFEADLPQGEDVYVLIHHRNHLSVMSAQPATNTSAGVICSTDPDYCVDFRDKQSYIGCGQVSLSDSDELYGMYAGDVGRTGLITRADLAFIGDNDSERPTYARMIEGNYLVDGDLDFSGLIARGDETEVGNNDSESSACSYRIVGN